MHETQDPTDTPTTAIYAIRLKGHLDERWSRWLGGLTVTQEADGSTRLTGPVVDQAALYGLLRRIRDLGVPLLAVCRLTAHKTPASQPDDGQEPSRGKKN